jgi:hypothetical protein
MARVATMFCIVLLVILHVAKSLVITAAPVSGTSTYLSSWSKLYVMLDHFFTRDRTSAFAQTHDANFTYTQGSPLSGVSDLENGKSAVAFTHCTIEDMFTASNVCCNAEKSHTRRTPF